MLFNKKTKLDLGLINSQVEEAVNELSKYAEDGDDTSLEMVRYGLNDLKYLLVSIRRFEQIDSGDMKLNMFPINPISSISDVVSKFKGRGNLKGIDISFRHTVSDVKIEVDEKIFKEILRNLIDNAVKYTPKGKIKVSAEREGNDLIIRIQDTGVGIDMKEKENIFKMNYRVDNVATSETKGFGLGLWITKELVEKMRGDISFESVRGVGTEFILRFKYC